LGYTHSTPLLGVGGVLSYYFLYLKAWEKYTKKREEKKKKY